MQAYSGSSLPVVAISWCDSGSMLKEEREGAHVICASLVVACPDEALPPKIMTMSTVFPEDEGLPPKSITESTVWLDEQDFLPPKSFTESTLGLDEQPAPQASAELAGSEEELEGLPTLLTGRASEATFGSEKHSIGECRPCAWFYKPAGCQNGASCRHCHMCPESAIKARKKSKAVAMRLQPEPALSESDVQQTQLSEPVKVQLELPGQAEVVASKIDAMDIEAPIEQPLSPPGLSRTAEASIEKPLSPPGLSRAEEALVSRGSLLHGTGECRPCAWFYKPGGCQNAVQCGHCHLCPEGEIKARRKVKVEKIRSTEEAEQVEQPESQAGSAGSITTSSSGAEAQAHQPAVKSEGVAEVTEAAEKAQAAQKSEAAQLEPTSRKQGPQPVSSLGSEQHGTGHCRPCAWFHKPGGCANGQQCRHCHLCEEGVIRERRRVKVSAMKRQSLDEQHMLEQALWLSQQQEALFATQWQAELLMQAAREAFVESVPKDPSSYDLGSPMSIVPPGLEAN